MIEKERLNALEVALSNELQEREFYLKHAQRTKNPLGKAMFQQIGSEELEHYKKLQELKQKWANEGKWPETVPLRVNDTVVENILQDMFKKAEDLPEGDDDDLVAIREAIDFEANGAKRYAELRDLIADPKEKQFFNLLANIEHAHYLSLKDTEEFLTDPVSWYQKKERHGLDGA